MSGVFTLMWNDEGECLRNESGEAGQILIPNQPRTTHKAYGSMLTNICDEGVYWSRKMFIFIRRAYRLNDESLVLSGLHDPQVVQLLCRLDFKGSE